MRAGRQAKRCQRRRRKRKKSINERAHYTQIRRPPPQVVSTITRHHEGLAFASKHKLGRAIKSPPPKKDKGSNNQIKRGGSCCESHVLTGPSVSHNQLMFPCPCDGPVLSGTSRIPLATASKPHGPYSHFGLSEMGTKLVSFLETPLSQLPGPFYPGLCRGGGVRPVSLGSQSFWDNCDQHLGSHLDIRYLTICQLRAPMGNCPSKHWRWTNDFQCQLDSCDERTVFGRRDRLELQR